MDPLFHRVSFSFKVDVLKITPGSSTKFECYFTGVTNAIITRDFKLINVLGSDSDPDVRGRFPRQGHSELIFLKKIGVLGNEALIVRHPITIHGNNNHVSRIIIIHLNWNAPHGDPFICSGSELTHLMRNVQHATPFSIIISDCLNVNLLRLVPIIPIKEQIHPVLVPITVPCNWKAQALGPGIFILITQVRWPSIEGDHWLRGPGKYYCVFIYQNIIQRRPATLIVLKYHQRAGILRNNQSSLIIINDAHREVRQEWILIFTCDLKERLLHQATVTVQSITDNCDRLTVITAHIKSITTETTNNFNLHTITRSSDKESIIPFSSINDQFLNASIGYEKPASEYPISIDHKIIAKFSAHYGQSVKPVSTINIYRGIERVWYKVRPLSPVNVCPWSLRIRLIHPHKCPNQERIITVLTEEEHLCLVTVYDKWIISFAAMKVCRFTYPVTEESSRGLGRLKVITDIESVRWIHVIPGRFIYLTKLETVIALTTMNNQIRQRIIKDKSIIPWPPVHRNCLNFTIVIDSLKEAA